MGNTIAQVSLRLLPLLLAAGSATGDSSGWRGDGTGRFPAAAIAVDWNDAGSIIWKRDLTKWSNASPVIAGDRLFVCAEPDLLICLDKGTGELLWQHANSYTDIAPEDHQQSVAASVEQAARVQRELHQTGQNLRRLRQQSEREPDNDGIKTEIAALQARQRELQEDMASLEPYRMPEAHNANGYSSPTPVTDGARVYVFFGTGVAAAYDLEGNRLWARVVEKPTAGWGHSASPVLAANRFVIHIRDVHGLDPATGETVWTVKSAPRWGASVTTRIDGTPVVITANGELIRAADGLLLAAGLHRLDYCAPMVHDGVVYFIEHGGKAFRLPDKADGSAPPVELWQTQPPKDRYYASPLYHDGHIYCVNQKGVYSVIDAATGAVLKSETLASLRRTVYSSVTLAGSQLFLGAESGSAVLLEPGIAMTEIAVARLEGFRTNPVIEGNRAYLRTLDGVTCIGTP